MLSINEKVLSIITANYISLDELFFLYLKFRSLSWEFSVTPASILKLKRMGLLNEEEVITSIGEHVVMSCLSEPEKVTPVLEEDKFDEFWLAYPLDDKFRSHPKTRILRWNKRLTHKSYTEALNRVTHEQLMQALANEKEYRQNSEVENLFKYMKSVKNWLDEEVYLNFLDVDVKEDNPSADYGKELG